MNPDIPMNLEREAGAHESVPAVAVGFGMHPMEDQQKSEAAGHPVFVDVEFVQIAVPGDKNSLYLQPATKKDRERYPRAYASFKERGVRPTEGLPIEEWPQVTRGQAMTLRAMHIHTVEALAEVHDGNVGVLGQNGRELVAKAKAFVKHASESASTHKQAAENQQLRDQIELQGQQLAQLAKLLEDKTGQKLDLAFKPPAAAAPKAKPKSKPKPAAAKAA